MSGPPFNPFASPVLPEDREASPRGTPGSWRDRHYLVVHPYEAKLPAVCLKSGRRYDVSFEAYELPFQSRADFGDFTLKIDVPLSKAYRRNWLFIGLLVPLVGCLLGCSGIVFMVAETAIFPRELLTVIGLLGIGLLIFGLVFGGWWFWHPPLRPVAASEPYIWLTGACPAFLEELPPLPRGMHGPA
jgi:hypothetical protein